jgi:copper chaperone CopZ
MRTFLALTFTTLTFATMALSPAPAPAEKGKKTETVRIQSSTICDMCEKTIEENLIYEKGVKKVDVDLTTASVSITFDPRKTDPAALRTALTKLGYSADGVAADSAAFAKLPACCQKEGCGKLPPKP